MPEITLSQAISASGPMRPCDRSDSRGSLAAVPFGHQMNGHAEEGSPEDEEPYFPLAGRTLALIVYCPDL